MQKAESIVCWILCSLYYALIDFLDFSPVASYWHLAWTKLTTNLYLESFDRQRRRREIDSVNLSSTCEARAAFRTDKFTIRDNLMPAVELL